MMFYLMDATTLDMFETRLGALRTGRSRVEYRATRDRTLSEMRALIVELLLASARSRSAEV